MLRNGSSEIRSLCLPYLNHYDSVRTEELAETVKILQSAADASLGFELMHSGSVLCGVTVCCVVCTPHTKAATQANTARNLTDAAHT